MSVGYPHLFPVLSRRAVGDGQGAGDEVVLHVHHDQRGHRTDDLRKGGGGTASG